MASQISSSSADETACDSAKVRTSSFGTNRGNHDLKTPIPESAEVTYFAASQHSVTSLESIKSVDPQIQNIKNAAHVNQQKIRCLTPQAVSEQKMEEIPQNFKIASLNVRSCNEGEKREQIYLILNREEISLAFLQESKRASGITSKTNFNWRLIGIEA